MSCKMDLSGQTTRDPVDPYADLAYAVIEMARRDIMVDYSQANIKGSHSVAVTRAAWRSAIAFFRHRDYRAWADLAHVGWTSMERIRIAVLKSSRRKRGVI